MLTIKGNKEIYNIKINKFLTINNIKAHLRYQTNKKHIIVHKNKVLQGQTKIKDNQIEDGDII